ncbi:sodium:proton antiporter [Helicobacter cholecystus]|uniref:Sodium:proton antiporter n=1 Tax=Helicobacter cholecystus TaxID=45498 RepID=A0A3D8IXK9_9HELI|nr:SLC13 family permease [Helicobacter cholecystus]RDU69706.1 sodium:proton antiporter [Helicobacter cholecystus]
MITNPVVVSILVMSALCLMRFNVLLAIAYSALLAGLISGMPLLKTMDIFIHGMSGNLETALSYILLGAIAYGISQSNLTKILIHWVAKFVGSKKILFCLFIALISCFSQNLIPVHIAFIPILIPPLLALMNELKIDRRAVACAISFGLQAPYIALPVGFGLIFQNIIKDNLTQNGVSVSLSEVTGVMWMGGVAMLIGLLLAIFVFYVRPRNYVQTRLEQRGFDTSELTMRKQDYGVLLGAIATFVIQLITSSLPLGALGGLLIMILSGGISYKKIDKVMEGGMAMMAFIAFVMLVASGFGAILKESGSIEILASSVSGMLGGYGISALIMLLVGLFITMGIGTSFGTIPIIAAVFCPLALSLNFSIPSIILLVGIAGALGDSGSPASDSTLGPTSGLNADGQHNHIWDTCVPTFLMYNIPLIIVGVIGVILLNG